MYLHSVFTKVFDYNDAHIDPTTFLTPKWFFYVYACMKSKSLFTPVLKEYFVFL